jgi:NADH:ubiquinone oxidoreductase subunit 6 (subunit J)
MFLLGPIAATLRWLEELANLLSGPLLVAGLAIALIDLLTDGQLLTAVPALLYAWAIAQAVGVDAQLVGAWDRAKRAVLRRQWWHVAGLVLLGGVLAYVAYVAGYVFAVQESAHISEAAALSRLGMNATTWLWQRVGVSVFLVCLSGYTRYRTPRQTSLEDERAKLERELTLEPLRQRVRGVKLAGVRAAATALVGSPAPSPDTSSDMPADASTMATTAREDGDGTTLPDNAYTSLAGAHSDVQRPSDGLDDVGVRTPQETPDDTTPPTHPTGPGTPVTAPSIRRQRRSSQPAILRLTPDRPRSQRQAAQGKVASVQGVRTPNESLEPTARAAFAQGATSIAKMERQTGMSHTAARHWIGVLKAERDATSSAHTSQRLQLPAPTLPLPGDAFRGVLSDDASADAGEGYAL